MSYFKPWCVGCPERIARPERGCERQGGTPTPFRCLKLQWLLPPIGSRGARSAPENSILRAQVIVSLLISAIMLGVKLTSVPAIIRTVSRERELKMLIEELDKGQSSIPAALAERVRRATLRDQVFTVRRCRAVFYVGTNRTSQAHAHSRRRTRAVHRRAQTPCTSNRQHTHSGSGVATCVHLVDHVTER
jgi:hypothetical protein